MVRYLFIFGAVSFAAVAFSDFVSDRAVAPDSRNAAIDMPVSDGEPAVQEPEKNGGLAWFALDALPDLVPPHERVVLGLLATSLEPGGAPVPPITTFGFRDGEDIELYREAREH